MRRHARLGLGAAAQLAHVLHDEGALADGLEGAQPPPHRRRHAVHLELVRQPTLRLAARAAQVVALDPEAVGRAAVLPIALPAEQQVCAEALRRA